MTARSMEAPEIEGMPPGTLSDDAFLGGRLMLLQPRKGYRAGLDAVLLAAAAPLDAVACHDRPLRVLDAGAGVGTVGLCLARRVACAEVTLVERDPLLARLARANIHRNGLDGRVGLVEADIAAPLATAPGLAALAESFDLVLANPPYHDEGFGTPAPDALKAASNAMPAGRIERWMRFMASMARADGMVALIHRPEALGAILAASDKRFGALRVRPFHPRAAADANRIIVEGRKGSRAPLTVSCGRALHGTDGRYRPDIEAALRDGAALPETSAEGAN